VPFADPVAPLVIDIHPALLTALHAHPVPAVTATLPVVAPDATARLPGEMVGAHNALNENALERVLGASPPGPTAATRAS
jgi:hypothetical protein